MNDLTPEPRRALPDPEFGSQPAPVNQGIGYPEASANDLDLKEVLRVIRRHVSLVLVVALIGLGIAALSVYLHVPQFKARATLRVTDTRKAMTGGIEEIGVDQLLGKATDPLLSQVQAMRSRTVIGSVVQQEGLQIWSGTRELLDNNIDVASVQPVERRDTLHIVFTKTGYSVSNSGRELGNAQYGVPVVTPVATFTILGPPAVAQADLFVGNLETTVDAILAKLRTTRREGTDLVDVEFTSADKYRAARVTNALVDAFREFSLASAQQTSRRRRIFIEEQLQQTDSMLAVAQGALSQFRTNQQLLSPRAQMTAEQTGLFGLEVRREELIAEKRMYDNMLTRIGARPSSNQLETLMSSPGLMQNPVIAQLSVQLANFEMRRDSATTGTFGSARTNPDVARLDTLIASTQSRIVTAARSHASSLDARIAALDDLKQRSQASMSILPEAESQEARLVQQVEIASRMADQLRTEFQLSRIAEAVEAGSVDVLDRADVPRLPLNDRRDLKLALGMVLGLMFGAGAAVVREHLNTSIRRRDEMETLLQLPSLAVIPQVGDNTPRNRFKRLTGSENGEKKDRTKDLITLSDTRSSASEAYRTLRTNLLFAQAAHNLRSIAVTSALAAEGKTTTAANLATTFAQQGLKVLLVDCDLRKSQVHRTFALQRSPGFTELILGQATMDEAVRRTQVPGLSVLTSGIAPPSPAELLGSARARELFARLSEGVDLMIVDAPPVLMATDASIIAQMVDGMIMVVRAGQTDRQAAQQARQQLQSVNAYMIGAVLNDPDAEIKRYGDYYYAYGYYGDES